MTETDDRLPPPEWLDEKLVAQALRNAEQDEGLAVEAHQVEWACGRGVNFLSEMLRVRARYRTAAGQARQRSLLVKSQLREGAVRQTVQESGMFLRETLAYTVLLPTAEAALRAAEGGECRPLAARCHLSGSRPVDWLVLDDLSEAGFAMSAPGRLLDSRHCALALRALARLHAASALLAGHPALAADCFSRLPLFSQCGREHFSALTGKLYTAVADALETIAGCEKYAHKYREITAHVFDRLEVVFSSCRPRLKVLAHGDLWKNNLMFRYVDGCPVDVRLVDFQNCYWASPAADVQHLLGSSASLEVLRDHVDPLLAEYHGVLQATLRALGLQQQADDYPLEALQSELRHFALHALNMATVMPPFILAPESAGKDAEEAVNNSQDNDAYFKRIVANPEHISRIKYILPVYEKAGAI